MRFLVSEPSDADDVVQDIYLELHRSLAQYDEARAFRPWLMGLVMRQVQAYRRKGWRQLRISKKAQQTFSGGELDEVQRLIGELKALNAKVTDLDGSIHMDRFSKDDLSSQATLIEELNPYLKKLGILLKPSS
ncbi:RNA polymerase sigma factor [compost metagenome]